MQTELDSSSKKNKTIIANNKTLESDVQKLKKRLQELDATSKELKNTCELLKSDVIKIFFFLNFKIFNNCKIFRKIA